MINKEIFWIEINLPWNYNNSKIYPKFPDLSEKEKQYFGISVEESRNNVEEYWKYYYKIQEEIANKLDSDFKNLGEEEFSKKEEELWKFYENDPQISAINEHRKFVKIANEWLDEQPEFRQYAEECNKIKENCNQKSFTGRGLNKSGTLIELENGEQYLIGDVNELGGLCNDCTAFHSNVIIKRYAVLIELSTC